MYLISPYLLQQQQQLRTVLNKKNCVRQNSKKKSKKADLTEGLRKEGKMST